MQGPTHTIVKGPVLAAMLAVFMAWSEVDLLASALRKDFANVFKPFCPRLRWKWFWLRALNFFTSTIRTSGTDPDLCLADMQGVGGGALRMGSGTTSWLQWILCLTFSSFC